MLQWHAAGDDRLWPEQENDSDIHERMMQTCPLLVKDKLTSPVFAYSRHRLCSSASHRHLFIIGRVNTASLSVHSVRLRDVMLLSTTASYFTKATNLFTLQTPRPQRRTSLKVVYFIMLLCTQTFTMPYMTEIQSIILTDVKKQVEKLGKKTF